MSSWKPTKKTQAIISAAASAAATAMFIRKIVIDYKSLASDFIPSELRNYIYLKFKPILYFSLSSDLTFVIEEYDNLNHNNLFKSVEIYLESIIPPDTPRLKISLPNKETNFSVSLERNEEVTDAFQGVDLNWKFISNSSRTKWLLDRDNYTPVYERRLFELSFHKKHKDMVLDTYLNHVVEKSKEMIAKKKTLKLHTLAIDRLNGSRRGGDVWQAVNLDHPANFETIAMDTDTKKMIMEDLEMFVKRKDFYRRVGKAWKRGYLLYGPPGTGKTSLIAAMANYLNFDVYDLELTDVKMNSDLRKLLISTANKSILVVEDIDCTIELQNRLNKDSKTKERSSFDQANQVTLSGLLNFIDGLWSSCGDERIIIFTTNHVEKLDPALLRPGRMDLHIHMSYCTTSGFRTLAYNYLGITEHSLFIEIEELIEITKVTPAEIGEKLMKIEKSDDAVLSGLIEFLDRKKKQQDEQDETANKVIVEDETEKMISNNDVEQIQKKD